MSIRITPSPGGLRVPDSSKGTQGGFGANSQPAGTMVVGEDYAVPFTAARTLTDVGDITESVDNAYMAWDPEAPTLFTIKEPLWCAVEVLLGFDGPLPEVLNFGVDGVGGGGFSNAVDIDIPAGGGDGNSWGYSFSYVSFFYGPTQFTLTLHNSSSAIADDVDVMWADIAFVPLSAVTL